MSAPPQPLPKVTLVTSPSQAFNTAIAAARTCYSGRVITAEEVGATPQSREQRDRIAQSTFEAGHHTVYQHAHLTFVLEEISRQAVWSFLHAHPFYNSEQVSQRYVEVKPGRYVIPALEDGHRKVFVETVEDMHRCYRDLVADLTPVVERVFFCIFPSRGKRRETYAKDVKKKAQEMARYVLPVATHAHLYHTISALTLFRYWRLCGQLDVPTEVRAVVEQMVEQTRGGDPDLFSLLQDPIPLEETLEAQVLLALEGHGRADGDASEFRRSFDARLNGHTSRLVGFSPDAERLVADAVRDILGLTPHAMDDQAALDAVLDPARNHYLGEALNLSAQAKLPRALNHASYTFQKKLSHTADSQDQRHRMTPGSRPVLARQVDLGAVDVIFPSLLAQSPEAMQRASACMERVWRAMRQLRDAGVSSEKWAYLLPNAFPVRFTESGDLMHHHHKWTTRLCLNAQEEIWLASVDEVRQVREVHPRLARWLLPPCGLRLQAQVTPYCPEGARYCGIPMWKQDVTSHLRQL